MTDEKRTKPDADHPLDGGAYIGNRPELAEETIPGGVQPNDERVAAHDSRSSGGGKQEERVQGREDEWPAGHRDAETGSGGT
jgi:hypothetical protein